ncbi:hypothetical protein CHS0354_015187 [Potamilus streckersoni]|uniref:Uncharacterized protein n=1 Tax=Potamilus streckersoni TaxID=2493646 RepID=A0AAE0VTP5_9BIVA|nr:hypothetical protein CHS0354_015187 [Potamilus streckersoni]
MSEKQATIIAKCSGPPLTLLLRCQIAMVNMSPIVSNWTYDYLMKNGFLLNLTDLPPKICEPMIRSVNDKLLYVSVVLFGGISVVLAFLVAMIGGTLVQVLSVVGMANQITGSVLSAFGGPLTGLFLLGAIFPFANAKAISNWIGFLSHVSNR